MLGFCKTTIPLRRAVLSAIVGALFCAMASPVLAHAPHAFFVKRIWTGREVIDNGVLILDHDKVLAVGAANLIEVPEGAIRHQMPDAVIIPGLVIAETSLGSTSRDSQRTLTPEVRAVDGFDFYADYSKVIAGGVTTVQVSPGRARLMPGMGGVVKLTGGDPSDRILSDAESLRLILTSASRQAPRIYEPPTGAVSVDNPLKPTRYQVGTTLPAAVAALRAVFQTSKDGKQLGEGAVFDFAALQEAMKTGRLRITANTAAEIRSALQLAKEFNFKVTLVDPVSLDRLIDKGRPEELAGLILNIGVRPGTITNPTIPNPELPRRKAPWEFAAEMIKNNMGAAIALRPASDADLDDMLFLAGLFKRGGTSTKDALAMLTVNPAKLLGVDDRVGELSPGFDADFVVLSGDPFSAGSTVMSTWVNGESQFNREKQDEIVVVKADNIYTGQDVISDAAVVVSNAKIRGVGTHVSAPANANYKTFPGATIVPGYIDLSTKLGWGGTVSGASVSTKLGDRLTSDDANVDYARQGGITTAILAASGTVTPVMAFKLGKKPRVLKDPIGIKFAISSNLTSAIPSLKRTLTTAKSYHDAWTKYEAAVEQYKKDLKDYEVAKAKYDAEQKAAAAKKAAEAKKAADAKTASSKSSSSSAKTAESKDDKKDAEKKDDSKDKKDADEKKEPSDKSTSSDDKSKTSKSSSTGSKSTASKADPNAPKKPTEPKKPRSSSTYEPYRALFSGKIPAFVEADTYLKIKAAVNLFREDFKLNTILVGANDLHRATDLLSKHEVRVAVGPTLVRDIENDTFNLPQILANHQIQFGFQSQATTGARQLPWAVKYAVHKGLGTNDALRGLTSGPAKLLSIENHVGAIKVGHDADLIVLSGPPFELSSEVLAVMIDGEWVYEKEETE